MQNLPWPHVSSRELTHLVVSNNETQGMDLEVVDNLFKNINGVKCLLVHHNVFHNGSDAKRMKTKDSEGSVPAFLTMIIENKQPSNIWVNTGTKTAGEFEKTKPS